ncbi:MAG: ATP-dependent Clp protease adapter ClpS [Gammaproteobacteria bacterium]|nr:ATP-dependent Clp protease adapter ClpS [Gammaproteobacteria bacterium]MCH9762999.1 ATP-dependent Clp protease adapter ClpS [Gammaproteobacteria bacterium]
MPRQMPPDIEEKVVRKASLELAIQTPKQYQVILYNDDYTPMAFVVDVIQRIFHLKEDVAVRLMIQVHEEGRAVCGVFTHDVAETMVGLVNGYARLNQYPLLCEMEAV